MYTHKYTCIHIYIYIYIYIDTHVHIYVYMYTHTYICIYICIYIRIHTHTHTHTHAHTPHELAPTWCSTAQFPLQPTPRIPMSPIYPTPLQTATRRFENSGKSLKSHLYSPFADLRRGLCMWLWLRRDLCTWLWLWLRLWKWERRWEWQWLFLWL